MKTVVFHLQAKTCEKDISKLKEEIESLNNEIQIAQRNYDLNKAAEFKNAG